MLDAIFGSAPRVKILNLLLLAPDKSYTREQLAASLSLTAVSVRLELNNLIKFGLIKEEKRAYSANSSFLLYPELRALFTKAQILFSEKFISGLQKICQPKFLALTGLFTNYPQAQTDILIVGTVKRVAFTKLLHDLEKNLGREINFTILSEREFHYREDLMDIFLYNILEGQTLVLVDNLHKKTQETYEKISS
jgi:hypothetical protein